MGRALAGRVQAVVLVGGKGTRLRPLTGATPKPLLPIVGRPLIAHLLDRFPPEIDEVILAVSYMADAVAAWARAREDPALAARRVIIVEEDPPRGTGGALANLAERIGGRFVVLNGDLVTDLDVAALLARHSERGSKATMALVRVPDPSRFGVVELGAGDEVRRFVEKPPPGEEPSDFVNAGAYVLERDILAPIPGDRPVSLERDVFPGLAARGELMGYRHEGLWIDCGTARSYLAANAALRERAGVDVLLLPGGEVAVDAVVTGSVVGARAVVGPGAHVVASVLHDRAVVAAGARVVESVIGAKAEVGAGAVVEGCVIGPGVQVGAGEVRRDEQA